MRGLPRSERPRPKKLVRIGTLNETLWKGAKAREIGEGVKPSYNAEDTKQNGVAIAKAEPLQDSVTTVNRVSSRIMVVRIDTKEGQWTIISVYAPQAGCPVYEKDKFYLSLDEAIRSVPEIDHLTIAGREIGLQALAKDRAPEDLAAYRTSKRLAKAAVATEMDALYEKLDSREGEKFVFRLAKARHRATQDIGVVKSVRNSEGAILRKPRERQRLDGIAIVAWKALGEEESQVRGVPISKQKGDAMECSIYRGIRLTAHTMKLSERLVDSRLRELVPISQEQFSFIPERSTTEVIFIARQTPQIY
ncbi:hypothetical protein V3C99_002873 [Haemonchus contortus]|uniref:S1 motif domain-containing protein n=1 Tax=Haemonchus contortus TaxID=6289 RepID=A0A7I5E8J4_HAECO